MSRRRSSAKVAALVASLVAVLVPAGLQPAAAGDVIVVDLPVTPREDPRALELLASTATQGIVARREEDHRGSGWGSLAAWVLDADGLTRVDASARDAVGDRLVEGPYSQFSRRLRSKLLPVGEWDEVVLPDHRTLVDYTGDGVLTSTHAAPTLSLLPWSGGDPVPITGVPEGFGPTSYDLPSTDVHDGTGAVVRVVARTGGSASHRMIVDTTSAQSWVLPEAGTCDARLGTAFGLGPEQVAWRSGDGTAICTVPRPEPGSLAVQPVTKRAAPTLPVQDQADDVALMPVAGVVVASVRTFEPYQRATAELPVLAVHQDGTTTELLGWGHSVVPIDGQRVAAVGGDVPQSTVRQIEVSPGSVTTLLADEPVPAVTSGIAVDRDRLVTSELSTVVDPGTRTIAEYEVDPSAGEYLGRRVLATGSDNWVPAASDGATAWSRGTSWVRQGADGTRTSNEVALPATGVVSAIAGDHLALGSDAYVDTRTNTLTRAERWERYGAVYQEGVRYTPGSSTLNGPVDAVAVRDLDSGRGTSIPVPGCVKVQGVQVAGTWVLAKCFPDGSDPGPSAYHLIDRSTGSTTTFDISTYGVELGNGFLARIDAEGRLVWAPAHDPTAWQTVATPGLAAEFVTAAGAVSALGWTDGHTNHVAFLPVEPRPAPVPDFDVATPRPPQVSVTRSSDSQLTVSWADPDPEEQITGYAMSVNGNYPQILPGTARSQVLNINPDIRTDVRVWAGSVAGSTSTLHSYNAKPRPPAPTNVVATVDKASLRARVSWDWAPVEGTQPITGFEVRVNNVSHYVGDQNSTSGASTEIYYGQEWTGRISVVATTGWEDSEPGWSNTVTFPGPDREPPVVSLSLPALSYREITPVLSGTDDRGWFAFELRHRESDGIGALGPWSWWDASAPGVAEPTAGSTHCYTVRGRDGSGNYSEWTPPRCTSAVVDQRTFTRKGTWRRVDGARYLQRFAFRATRGTPSLVVGRRSAAAVWVLASTCPTCGSIRVKDSGGYAVNVSLRSSSVRAPTAVRVPWPQPSSGTITITRLRKAGAVTIDGIAYQAE